MANVPAHIQQSIDDFEKDLAEAERHVNEILSAINLLRAKAGLPPRSPSGGGGLTHAGESQSQPTGIQIKHDTFFGKKMGTASRLYLEMRHGAAAGTNPAKPREIFDALKQGGFVFETKDDGVAIISLRNMLRKNTQMFQKLPNGTYGLRSWYPNAKRPKTAVEEAAHPNDSNSDDEDSTAPKVA